MIPSNIRACLAFVIAIATCSPALAAPDFDHAIAPLLASRCLECHSGADPKGQLDLTLKENAQRGGKNGAALVSGKPDESMLWQYIEADEMPPKKPLTADEKKLVREWIEAGANWSEAAIDPLRYSNAQRAGYDWWSLQPVQNSAVPNVKLNQRVRNEIDAFVLAKLESAGLSYSPEASARELVRRLNFDLCGLPPTPEQVAKFVADPSEQAYEEMVDTLLASPHYGERWGRHWLDIARYGESDGFERNAPRRNAWPYRDWVIKALNDDMPYDQFARLQIAGDAFASNTPEGVAATGFLVAGVHNTVVGSSPLMQKLARQDELEEIVGTLGQTFLGMTINCARCHDHKFDPISQTEYYRMIACLDGVRHGERVVTSTDKSPELAAVRQKLTGFIAQLDKIDAKAKEAATKLFQDSPSQKPQPPAPIARWEFESDLNDAIGDLHLELAGQAKLVDGSLVVGENAYALSTPIKSDLSAKTLEAWVQVDDLNQAGGGVISLQTLNGDVFDAIVFAEREPKQWIAGSDAYRRTKSFQATEDNFAAKQPVHIAIVYQADGQIIGYRDGVPYGQGYSAASPVKFEAGKAQIAFGMRHSPAGGNRMLRGRIFRAQLYDRALSPDEVAASAGIKSKFVSEQQLIAMLTPQEQAKRGKIKSQIETLRNTETQLKAANSSQKMHAVISGTLAPTHLLRRGDVDKVGDQVVPGFIQSIGNNTNDNLSAQSTDADRRMALANWLSSPQNPLFARVMVNRVWRHHFGAGLIETPNDFGFNAGQPSHPELLDWLSSQFVADGFRLKKLHKRIVLSSAYRQSSIFNVTAARQDAGNRLLWRKSPRRLDAEEIRDAILSVSGKLNLVAGGPGFEDVTTQENNGTTYYRPIFRDDAKLFRRTVYRFTPRGERSALLDTFDCPDPSATAPRRSVTTTPLQALSLMNNELVIHMSNELAARAEREIPDEQTSQINQVFALTIGRLPSQAELTASSKLVKEHGLRALCRALFNSNEFVVIN